MPEISITQEEYTQIVFLKKQKVLQPINVGKLVLDNGAMFVSCADSKHFLDKIRHLRKLLKEKGSPQEIFPITRGGGAIWLANSVLIDTVGIPRDLDILFDIKVGIEKRNHTSLLLSEHVVCGAASEYNLSIYDLIELLVLAKQRVEHEFKDAKFKLAVNTLFHVCYSGEKRRTYHVSPERWKETKKTISNYSPDLLVSKSVRANA